MTVKILVINPNSSEKVTKNLEKQLLNRKMFNCFSIPVHQIHQKKSPLPLHYNQKRLYLKIFKVNIEDRLNYDGYLVCCYSDHPLVYSLGKLTKKPVMGIMQATLLFALLQPTTKTTKLFILTSTSEWELVLDQSIIDFVGADNFPVKNLRKLEV